MCTTLFLIEIDLCSFIFPSEKVIFQKQVQQISLLSKPWSVIDHFVLVFHSNNSPSARLNTFSLWLDAQCDAYKKIKLKDIGTEIILLCKSNL